MRRPTLSIALPLAGALVAALVILPRPCGACPPSGGPGEILFLHLDLVRVDGALVETGPYGVEHMRIEGVGEEFLLKILQETPKVEAQFRK